MAKLFGAPALIALVILSFWIASWSTPKAKIYGGLFVLLALEILPLLLFVGNTVYPSNYYIAPNDEIVIQRFPGNVWEGKATGTVDADVVAAYDWQHGKRTDASGNPLKFFTRKTDGTILVYPYPVEKGTVLSRLDMATTDAYTKQELARARTFLETGDREKAKKILSDLQVLNPHDDDVYRLGQQIKLQEQDEVARLEAERQAEELRQQEQLRQQEDELAAKAESENDTDVIADSSNTKSSRSRISGPNISRRRTSYTRETSYEKPYRPQYQEPYRAPVVEQYRPSFSSPKIETPKTTVRPPSASNAEQPKEKKGMSTKKKILITGGIIGAGVVLEEIIRRRR